MFRLDIKLDQVICDGSIYDVENCLRWFKLVGWLEERFKFEDMGIFCILGVFLFGQ